MSWFAKPAPVDTSAAIAALDRADAAARSACLQSRTLSRAIRCGDPIRFVERLLGDAGARVRVVLSGLYPDMPSEPLTDDMTALLAEIERAERR